MMSPVEVSPEMGVGDVGPSSFCELRSVRWRINLGALPSSVHSNVDELRRVTADSRRRYAKLRRRLLIDPHITKFCDDSPDLVTDNPLSQNPDSTWGRFFRNAELEKMVDQDLSRLYPEPGSYFQTPGCQSLLRRILLLWCLRHPECGYRQGMHELLAPLIYVLHLDIQHLIKFCKLHKDHFVDKFDEDLLNETIPFNFNISSEENDVFPDKMKKHSSDTSPDTNLESIILLSDPYGAEGELGIVLSEKFMEHDAYNMFDALMSGSGDDVAMSEFFSSPGNTTNPGLPPIIEASKALHHLLSIVDPSLYTHVIELGVEPQYFALRWLRVHFGREFSLEDLLIIWDEIFSFSNSKLISEQRDSGVLNSARGAFISAMGVSMMLNVRSSLLATELATSCLQRLLNFPEEVDLEKIIGKAKSLVPLALDNANVPSHSDPMIKRNEVRRHSHSVSVDSSYWEEKWRSLQTEEEENQKEKSIQRAPSKKRGWTEKIKSKLSRVGSDSSLGGNTESKDQVKRPTVRRSLLNDSSRQLNAEEDIEESRNDNSDMGLSDSTSDEHSTVFSDPTSPLENDDETQTSSSFQSTTDDSPISVINAYPSDKFPKVMKTLSGKFQWLWKIGRHNSSEGSSSDIKVEVENGKSCDNLSPRKNKAESCASEINSDSVNQKMEVENENSCDDAILHANKSETCASEIKNEVKNGKFCDDASFHGNKAETCVSEINGDNVYQKFEVENGKCCDGEISVSEINCEYVNLIVGGCDQKLVSALRNMGQSLLENIQAIESAFQPERSEAGLEDQLCKHVVVEKGQVSVMTALKELRKISNLLQEV